MKAVVIHLYGGPKLTKPEIAKIHRAHKYGVTLGFQGAFPPVPWPCYRHEAIVTEIDGIDTQPGRDLHILPGRHLARVLYIKYPDLSDSTLSVACKPIYETSDLSIKFTAKAGHEYRIPAERRGERNFIWVEDAKTGKVVAGEKPPAEKSEGKPPTSSK